MFAPLCGCGSIDFSTILSKPKETINQAKAPATWQANLPHGGDTAKLKDFWNQTQDTLLLTLIEAAQKESPNVAAAKTRIAEANETRTSARANTLPTLDGTISTQRSKQQPSVTYSNQGQSSAGTQNANGQGSFGQGASNTTQINAQAAWELDVFGVNKVLLNAAEQQISASHAGWHEARISVAAEVATSYFNQRFCQLQQNVLADDVQSRSETLRLTNISVKAGFAAISAGQLAAAGLADAKQQLNTQQANCDVNIKELVALTGLEEQAIRAQLQAQAFTATATESLLTIDAIPANVISQRPDIYRAEADLVNAAANIASNQAAKYPRVTLNGSIGWMWLSGVGFSGNGSVWSLGPVSVTLPLYDGGKRDAKLASAQTSYEESAVQYRSKVRVAVKEVETALVNLHSAQTKQTDLEAAVAGYKAALTATQAKVKAGFANLIELEESRRLALQAETSRVSVQQARYNAWVALYRAAGGGWARDANAEPTNTMSDKEMKQP